LACLRNSFSFWAFLRHLTEFFTCVSDAEGSKNGLMKGAEEQKIKSSHSGEPRTLNNEVGRSKIIEPNAGLQDSGKIPPKKSDSGDKLNTRDIVD